MASSFKQSFEGKPFATPQTGSVKAMGMRNNQADADDLNASFGGTKRAANSKTLKNTGTKS